MSRPQDADAPERLTVEVTRTYPHDPKAYTEGLVYSENTLLESTGIKGQSQLRRTELESGEVLQAVTLAADVFAEGLASHDGSVVQLTLDSQRAMIWDAQTLTSKGERSYEGPGWGLCHNGRWFVMSDGSNALQLRDSETFEIVDTIEIREAEPHLRFLRFNELECVGDDVYANVFEYREIARISLSRRKITAWIDTRHLLAHPDVPTGSDDTALDLNGIAYIEASGHLLLTGKQWPRIFEVRLILDELFQ